MPKKTKERKTTKQLNTERRNADIIKRYDVLYNEERLRYDDTLKQLAREFYLDTKTILAILKSR